MVNPVSVPRLIPHRYQTRDKSWLVLELSMLGDGVAGTPLVGFEHFEEADDIAVSDAFEFADVVHAGLVVALTNDRVDQLWGVLRSVIELAVWPFQGGPELIHKVLEATRATGHAVGCLLYTSPSPRDQRGSRMPSSA